MANWDFVSVYDDEAADWLREQGYPHPAVRPGNVMPTAAELKWALGAHEKLVFDYPPHGERLAAREEGRGGARFIIEGFDWKKENWTPGDYFVLRGRSAVAFSVLIKLCERCGQLYLYPDTGEPSIVLDASLDSETVSELHREASEREDGWEYFFEALYGS